MLRSIAVAATLAAAATGCSKKDDASASNAAAVDVPASNPAGSGAPVKRKVDQVAPPTGIDVKNPPADAEHTADGLVFKSLAEGKGAAPLKNDTVLLNYTGWNAKGETFYSTKSRGRPVPMPLSNLAPGFVEAMLKMKQGGHAIFWLPPAIGYRGQPKAAPETLTFEVELAEIKPAPPIPPDVAAPPADAKKTTKGVAFEIVAPGTGKAKARAFDSVSFKYTAWDTTGRQFDSTETRGMPRQGMPLKEMPGLEDALTQMVVGEKARFWIPGGELTKGNLNAPAGTLCYEIELVDLRPAAKAPPPVPPDVAAPPKDAKKTAAGVFYKVLTPGKGTEHAAATDGVKVNYTGWTTDGRLFDSSFLKGQPADFSLSGVIKGWTDGLQTMVAGETTRFWIPVELAYNHQPGKPDGMLVFDVEMIEVHHGGAEPAAAPSPMTPHGPGGPHGPGEPHRAPPVPGHP
jgi:FKBP-type peptidyl-prolyl cis-trans isomerase